MGWFSRLCGASPEPQQTEPEEPLFAFDSDGPEKAAAQARQALALSDPEAAFERAVKAVDRLHDFYVFERFANRQPSSADVSLIDTLVDSLTAVRRDRPHADVTSGVMEATHRLRTISTAADAAGIDSSRYRLGLSELARVAPDVDVSGVFWH